MKHLTTKDGIKLHTKSWISSDSKAVILFTHGMFEHCERYDQEANYFNAQGYDFISYDQRSHGRSEGKLRSYIDDFEVYLDDYELFLEAFIPKDEKPCFLFAHSMGGLVLTSYLLRNKKLPENFKGVLLSAPLLMPDSTMAPLLQKMSGIIGTLLPKIKTISLESDAISRDPKVVAEYLADKLIYTDKIYAATGHALLSQMKAIHNRFDEITQPIIILHGTDDALSEIKGSRTLYENCSSSDKTFIPMKDYKHEITRDLEYEKVLDHYIEWMNKRYA